MFIAASFIMASNPKQPSPSTENAKTYLVHVYLFTQQCKKQNKTKKQTANASNSMDENQKHGVHMKPTQKTDTPWLYLQEVLQQAKVTYGEINKNGSCLWLVQGKLARNGHEETFWDDANILSLAKNSLNRYIYFL